MIIVKEIREVIGGYIIVCPPINYRGLTRPDYDAKADTEIIKQTIPEVLEAVRELCQKSRG